MRPSLARSPAGAVALRPARPGDAQAIADIHLESIRTLCRHRYEPAQLEAWTHGIDASLHRGAMRHAVVLVAERRGQLLGFAEYGPDRGEIVHLYVRSDTVGCGVGSLLLAEVERQAAADGHRALRLRASVNAERFYLKRGYVSASGPRELSIRGVAIPCCPLSKPLPEAATGP